VLEAAVGTVGVPVRAGELRGAYVLATYAVDANCVVLVPAVAVGAVGVPDRAGETTPASGSRRVGPVSRLMTAA